MTATSGWKLLCGVLAAVTVASWMREPPPASPPPSSQARPGAYRPLRISAAALGVTLDELVARLVTATSTNEMRTLAEQLGAVGDDAAIDAVLPLVGDLRPGVPEMIVRAIGAIGTEHAVDVLIDVVRGPRSEPKLAALSALAVTGNARAEAFLITLARRNEPAAIAALGQLATDRAVEVLLRIASVGNDDSSRTAIETLGAMDTVAAQKAIARLVDAPSVQTAIKALEAIRHVDAALLAKLTSLVTSGESELVRPALFAIKHAEEDAIPTLRQLAEAGTRPDIQIAAVQALGAIDSDEVVPILGGLVETGSDDLAREAVRALAALDQPEARDLVISAALSDRAEATQAVEALVTVQSPEIDPVLLEIARGGQYGANRALGRLLARDNTEALALVVTRAASPSPDERYAALELLAEAATETATSTLLTLVRAEHGDVKVRALGLVTSARPGDPQVTQMLRESLFSRNADEKRAAATALGKVGSDEARDALVSALSTGDREVTSVALEALSAYRLDEAAASAIHAAAISDPSLLPDAMRKLLSSGSPAGVRLAESALAGEPALAERALDLLRESSVPEAFDLMLRATRAAHADTRAAAIRVVGATRNERAFEAIRGALRDSSEQVRYTAMGALSNLGGDRARDALLVVTYSSDRDDRMLAVRYLPDDPAVVPRLRELTRDSDDSVAYYAMRQLALSNTGVAALRSMVFDTSVPFSRRYDAARMLDNYERLDDATRAWLEQVRGDEYYW